MGYVAIAPVIAGRNKAKPLGAPASRKRQLPAGGRQALAADTTTRFLEAVVRFEADALCPVRLPSSEPAAEQAVPLERVGLALSARLHQ